MTALLPIAWTPLLAQDGGSLISFLPFILVFVIFYLLVFRPSSKEKKQREEQVRNIKKHDRVVTNAGIHGVVVALDTDTVTLRVDDKLNARIRFARAAIWQVNPEGAGPTGAAELESEPQESASR